MHFVCTHIWLKSNKQWLILPFFALQSVSKKPKHFWPILKFWKPFMLQTTFFSNICVFHWKCSKHELLRFPRTQWIIFEFHFHVINNVLKSVFFSNLHIFWYFWDHFEVQFEGSHHLAERLITPRPQRTQKTLFSGRQRLSLRIKRSQILVSDRDLTAAFSVIPFLKL